MKRKQELEQTAQAGQILKCSKVVIELQLTALVRESKENTESDYDKLPYSKAVKKQCKNDDKVLDALNKGLTKFADIAKDSGVPKANLNSCLKRLESQGIAKKTGFGTYGKA